MIFNPKWQPAFTMGMSQTGKGEVRKSFMVKSAHLALNPLNSTSYPDPIILGVSEKSAV